jgi:hypothetical protein
MIREVKAIDLKVGMTISTDGLQIRQLVDYRGLLGKIFIGGVCHGTWKEAMFNPDETLPIYIGGE